MGGLEPPIFRTEDLSMPIKAAPSEAASKTLEQGLKVLTCFLQQPGELSLTEIARLLGRNTSSTYRLIVTLEKNDFLRRNPLNKRYSLGSMILRLGQAADGRQDLIAAAHPYLVRINREFNENVTVYVYENYRRLCLDRIESSHPLRQSVEIGQDLSLTRGAGGKALLAWMDPKVRTSVLLSEGGCTEDDLAKIRSDGYSVTYDEIGHGNIGIGAPIFGPDGKITAALNMSGPVPRMTDDVVQRGLEAICQAAAEISQKLGWNPMRKERS